MPPIEKTINRQLLIDMIVGTGVFQQLGLIPDKHTVTNILGFSDAEEVPLKIYTRKEQEGRVRIHGA